MFFETQRASYFLSLGDILTEAGAYMTYIKHPRNTSGPEACILPIFSPLRGGHIFDIGAVECSNVHSDLLHGMSQPPIIVPAGRAASDLQGGYRIIEGYLPPADLRKRRAEASKYVPISQGLLVIVVPPVFTGAGPSLGFTLCCNIYFDFTRTILSILFST